MELTLKMIEITYDIENYIPIIQQQLIFTIIGKILNKKYMFLIDLDLGPTSIYRKSFR